ncbi:TPA: hypothetical protein ACNZ88_004745, partial [Enterobacter kobei]
GFRDHYRCRSSPASFSTGGNMFLDLDNSFAIAIAPAINQIVKTVCLAIQLWLLKRYGIIKPTCEE